MRQQSERQARFSAALGVRIRRLRVERGLTQEQLAHATGMALYTIQKLERGTTPKGTPLDPRCFTLLKLCDALGVSLGELLDNS